MTGANGGEKWPVYRPYFANYLTIRTKVVNFMAISDHSFGCYKLQFCTVQNAKSGTGLCKRQGNGGMGRLPLRSLTLELMRNFLPPPHFQFRRSTFYFLLVLCHFLPLLTDLHPDFLGRAHRVEHAAHDLGRT